MTGGASVRNTGTTSAQLELAFWQGGRGANFKKSNKKAQGRCFVRSALTKGNSKAISLQSTSA